MNWKRIFTKADLGRQVKGHSIFVKIPTTEKFIHVTRKSLFNHIGKSKFACQVKHEENKVYIIFASMR